MESRVPIDYMVKSGDYEILIEMQTKRLTNSIVEQLVEVRKKKKMTQQDIADASGMKRANVARIEGRTYAPSMETLVRYAECLGVNLKLQIETETEPDNVAAGRVGIGIQNFSEVREGKYFYVDKTSFIKEWWESGDNTTLITRPRRFGKTLNMSMLEHFFSLKYAGRADLFEGLSIWEEEKYRQLQGTYPVISVSFANVKDSNYKSVSYRLRQILSNLYEEHSYLKSSTALSEAEKRYFDKVTENLSEEDAPMVLNRLSKFLHAHFGKKVIILLDEYDTPMQEAYVNGYWKELAAFTRVFFNCTFKTNPYMKRAVMTGITRVSKESFFSDLNHLKVVTASSEEYATAFGFTEYEVVSALRTVGLEKEQKKVALWYDGFTFGGRSGIYNPWSILNFLDTGKYEPYWVNTGNNGLISKLLREGNQRLKDIFERLLKDEVVRCSIDEQVTYERLSEDESAVLSLLLASGFLKSMGYEMMDTISIERKPQYFLKLVNKEVKTAFCIMVREWFREAESDYEGFINALLQSNLKMMNTYMNRLAMQVFSYFDTGKGPLGAEPERFYHGFVLGLLVELQGEYIITSNRESGYGRYDVMLEPKHKTKTAFLLEFKVRDATEEKDLQETVASALDQIEEKQYVQNLLARNIPMENIRCYGFAFEGKKVLIGEK